MTEMQDKDLEALLAQAAKQPPQPSAGLMDRVLADAFALQPAGLTVGHPPARAPQPLGVLARLAALFGGAPVLAGVCSAAVAGVALGYLNPESMDMLTGGLAGDVTGAETIDLFPSTDFLATEG
jgi:hypothetical protein